MTWQAYLRGASRLTGSFRGDISGKIKVRPPTKTELRSATRALKKTAGAYFLDIAHFPTREQCAAGREDTSVDI
jgi:hypothetical protein